MLLLAIGLAVVGLVGIQVLWLRQTMALKEAQFAQGVDNALHTVSERLERMERMRELRRHDSGRRMLVRLGSLRAEAARSKAALEKETPDDAMDWEEAPAPHEMPAPPDPLAMNGSDVHDPRDEEPIAMERELHEALVSDMVRDILASETGKDIKQRIDPQLLDSLLTRELQEAGVEPGWRYGVYSSTGHAATLHNEAGMDTAGLASTRFRQRLFGHDMAGTPYFLHLVVPDERTSLFTGMLTTVLVSVLFIVIIVAAFGFTIRTIVKQKRINDIRNDLVNNLTHELKTPISTIGLACEALSDPSMPKTEDQIRTFTTMIRAENKRLGSLVENVLQSAVLDSGQMLLKPVDLDLHAVIADVVRSSTMQVSRRNGLIELDLKAEIHHLRGDRTHLTNLLYNLIDNAVKYTEKEPRVRISTSSNDKGITLRIADNGIGIAASEHRKIFDRLYRVPTGDLHNAKGFGLGLSYVRTVVERHGGAVKVESTPGQGSTFQIDLPFEHVQTHEASAGRR